MASKKQKQELIDTLKFTPIRARIMIQGYGGECYIGSVHRSAYEYFKSKKIDVEQYANDWDGELFADVPEEHQFCRPGDPYDCDDRFRASGATMDDSSYITVMNDDTNEDIWESNLDINNLEDKGVDMVLTDDFDSSELESGTVLFWGGQGEKGCFFDGEIILKAPFDPKKLRIFYGNGDDWLLSGGVEYDGEEVDGSGGYSTTGKWGEHKFFIVGGEEVYEGRERGEDDEDDDNDDDEFDPAEELDKIEEPEITWHAGDPDKAGEYHVLIDAPWPDGGLSTAEWTGRTWKKDGKKVKITQWGTSDDPLDIPVLENEETWASRVIDESMMTPWWPGGQRPERKGEYEVFEQDSTWPFPLRAQWTGRRWTADGKTIEVREWRGLNQPVE